MYDLTPFGWLVAGGCALIVGLSKTGLPGMGILAVPLLATVIPAKASTGALLPMLICGDVFAVACYRRHAVWPHLLPLLPSAAVGVVVGALTMNKINDAQLRPALGAVVLAMLAMHQWRSRRTDAPVPSGRTFAVVMGVLAGYMTMLANAAGPIMMVYLLAMRLPRHEFIGTGAWYFLLLNCFKVPFQIWVGNIGFGSFRFNLMLFPVIAVGAVLGIVLLKRIPEKQFNAVVQILTAAAAVKLLF